MLFLLAIPAGCMPTIGAMVRARWTELYRGQPQLRTAFAFESVLDEVFFIAGPVISVVCRCRCSRRPVRCWR